MKLSLYLLFIPLTTLSFTKPPVVIDDSEAKAVLAIVAKHKAALPITSADWQALFSLPGYTRLKQREAVMNRDFTDEQFKSFVLSQELADRAADLQTTLAQWQGMDITQAGQRALSYLPPSATLAGTVYICIKPVSNSFVFETESENPAIFMYLDPKVSPAHLFNTVAHELHHIGFARACPNEPENLPQGRLLALRYSACFGEGLAMLAAAGSTNVHPHADSPIPDQERWDRDVAELAKNLADADRFFVDLIEERLTDKTEQRRRLMSLFGQQGAWYTVGWKMAVVIEDHYGRDHLISLLCTPWRLVTTYNQLARDNTELPTWSPQVIDAFTNVSL